jgi:hypothetical protein
MRVVNGEVAAIGQRYTQALERNREVAYAPALRAHEMVMHVVDVGIDPHAPGAEIEDSYFTERLEVVNGLVHGLQRDGGEVAANAFEQRLDGRMRVVAVQLGEDRLALWCDAQPMGPEPHGELIDGAHLAAELIDNDC